MLGLDDWPDELYVEFFAEIRGRMSLEEGEYFVRPIIEKFFKDTLDVNNAINDLEEILAKRIIPYKEYIPLPGIQQILLGLLKSNAEEITNSNYGYWHRENVHALRPYLTISGDEFKKLVGSSLRMEEAYLFGLIESKMPIDWVDEQTKEKINEHAVRIANREGGRNELVPNLEFIRKAVKAKFLKPEDGKKIVDERLKTYLNRKRISSEVALSKLLKTVRESDASEEIYVRATGKAKLELERIRNPSADNPRTVAKIKAIPGNTNLESFSS